MTYTGDRSSGPHRTLRSEVPSTVAVLADEVHFALMRGYRTFAFDDHRTYLRQMEELLRSLESQGVHTRVALFDPVDYELFCQEEELDPDDPGSRTRYTAEVAALGATVLYDGRPISRLVPQLLDARATRLTWEEAAECLARAGSCPHCGTDIGRAAFDRAARALALLLDAVGDGTHHMVCSVGVPGTPLVTALDAHREAGEGFRVGEASALALTTVLAAGLATGSPGGLVLRTDSAAGNDLVRGWSLDGDWLRPLTAAEVFTAYCTDPATGEPVGPEPGVDHLPGLSLPRPGGGIHC